MGNTYMTGKHQPESQKQKVRLALSGIIRSDKTRALVSDSGKMHGIHAKENNPAWKGGISFEPYCPKFTREFKERVRKFFKYICVGCGVHQSTLSRSLDVHHVNFNKMVCCDGVKPLFVALCRSCHSKTRHRPEHFEKYYTNIIMTRYGGKCYLEAGE